MGYRVKTVSAMTGIPRGTLLAWERRHDILEPLRSPSGYREYSDADVAVLRRLKALVDAGYSIGEAVELAKAQPDGLIEALAPRAEPSSAPASPPPRVDPDLATAPVVEGILHALLGFDRAGAERLMPRLGQVPFALAIDEVFVPVLGALGLAWQRGEVTIAQEHFVSGFCREHLLAMYHGLGGGPEGGITVACATPPGERHELGLLVLALKLALAGHRVVWLGADLPVPDLCAFLALQKPRFVCLSFTRQTSREALLQLARTVRNAAPQGTSVVLGGPGVAEHAGTALVEGVVVATVAELEGMLARAAHEPWLPGGARDIRASG